MNELKESGDFWATVHSNFLDCCVLEWCKLFIDTKHGKPGEHRWDNVVADKVRFKAKLCQHINYMLFQKLKSEMRTARKAYPSASGNAECCGDVGEFVVEQIANLLTVHGRYDRLSPLLDRVPTAFRRRGCLRSVSYRAALA